MSVLVKIKQKSLFKKKLNVEAIIKLTNLSYGVCDENYRLINNEVGNHILLYDEKHLARGIDLSQEGDDFIFLLSLPTTSSEIKTFYEIIEKVCNELKTKNYIREEEKVNLKENAKFIKDDEEGSVYGLKTIEEKINQDKYNRFEIFGVYNPISIGLKEISQIANNLDNFEKYLHEIQSIDVYYAAPRIYKIKEKLVGIYAIGPNISSVVPTSPYIILNQIQGIEEWYVMLGEGKTIKYDDFINNIKHKKYYDSNHVIVTLNDNDIAELIDKYFIKV